MSSQARTSQTVPLKSLRIELQGTQIPRTQFITAVLTTLYSFFDNDNNALVQLILEIIKNCYDHAHGLGVITIDEEETGKFRFSVTDGGTEPVDLAKAKLGSTKVGTNEYNFGLGMGMICDIGEMPAFSEFTIDTKTGFTYSGVFTIRIKKVNEEPPTEE